MSFQNPQTRFYGRLCREHADVPVEQKNNTAMTQLRLLVLLILQTANFRIILNDGLRLHEKNDTKRHFRWKQRWQKEIAQSRTLLW